MTSVLVPKITKIMILELQGKCQNYAWGKLGGTSKVAILGLKNGLQIVEETPYAELWIGTHPNGPSIVHPVAAKNSDFALKPLKDILTRKIVGDKVWEKFDQELPFLLKVSRYLIGICLVSVLYL